MQPYCTTCSDTGDLAVVQELRRGHYSIPVPLLAAYALVIALPWKWNSSNVVIRESNFCPAWRYEVKIR
jgi:hypothetical protein